MATTLSIRVGEEAKERLAKLAASTGRSRSYLAAEAIDSYLDVQEWQIAGVQRAIESVDQGRTIPHEEIVAWIESWGSGKERPMPKPRR